MAVVEPVVDPWLRERWPWADEGSCSLTTTPRIATSFTYLQHCTDLTCQSHVVCRCPAPQRPPGWVWPRPQLTADSGTALPVAGLGMSMAVAPAEATGLTGAVWVHGRHFASYGLLMLSTVGAVLLWDRSAVLVQHFPGPGPSAKPPLIRLTHATNPLSSPSHHPGHMPVLRPDYNSEDTRRPAPNPTAKSNLDPPPLLPSKWWGPDLWSRTFRTGPAAVARSAAQHSVPYVPHTVRIPNLTPLHRAAPNPNHLPLASRTKTPVQSGLAFALFGRSLGWTLRPEPMLSEDVSLLQVLTHAKQSFRRLLVEVSVHIISSLCNQWSGMLSHPIQLQLPVIFDETDQEERVHARHLERADLPLLGKAIDSLAASAQAFGQALLRDVFMNQGNCSLGTIYADAVRANYPSFRQPMLSWRLGRSSHLMQTQAGGGFGLGFQVFCGCKILATAGMGFGGGWSTQNYTVEGGQGGGGGLQAWSMNSGPAPYLSIGGGGGGPLEGHYGWAHDKHQVYISLEHPTMRALSRRISGQMGQCRAGLRVEGGGGGGFGLSASFSNAPNPDVVYGGGYGFQIHSVHFESPSCEEDKHYRV